MVGSRAWIALAPLLPLLPACSIFTTMLWPVGGFPDQRPLPVAGTTLFDWKGVVHCHSYLSPDSEGTVEEIRAACESAHIDFLVMTDHQSEASIAKGVRGKLGNTLFLVGSEVRAPGGGSMLSFPLQKPLRRWVNRGAMVAEAGRQGAIVLIGHAEEWKDWDVPGLAGVEIVNLHAGARGASKVKIALTLLFLPMRCLMGAVSVADPKVFANWDAQLQKHHPLAPVGGADAHANVHAFGPLGGTLGTYREFFLAISTHVLAETCDEASIVEAVKKGRTYVSFDVFHEGSGFDFRAVDGEGIHLPGDTVHASPRLALSVRTPAHGEIQLLRDGKVVSRKRAQELVLQNPAPGIYRVQVFTSSRRPWLFSSTIRVRP